MFFSIRRLACIAAIAGLTAIGAGSHTSAASFNEEQRKEIGTIVREYLLKNPEVLQEVAEQLEKKQQADATKAQADALKSLQNELFNSPHSMVVGNPAGNVTIIEFFDYNCSYCKKSLSDIVDILKTDRNIKIILKDLPVLGEDSGEAAKVSLAVSQQLKGDKFFEYHSTLLQTRGRVGEQQALDLAQKMGVDMTRLKKDISSPDIKSALNENYMLSEKLSIAGTPAFIIGGTVVPGAVGKQPMERMIADTRKCGKATC